MGIMEKLYLVKNHTSATKRNPNGGSDVSTKNIENIKVFKDIDRAKKIIKDWYNSWPKTGYFECGGYEVTKKEILCNGKIATVCYNVFGCCSVVDQYLLEEIDYDE